MQMIPSSITGSKKSQYKRLLYLRTSMLLIMSRPSIISWMTCLCPCNQGDLSYIKVFSKKILSSFKTTGLVYLITFNKTISIKDPKMNISQLTLMKVQVQAYISNRTSNLTKSMMCMSERSTQSQVSSKTLVVFIIVYSLRDS